MAEGLHFHTLDVFTDRPFGGNQLAVFPEAPELAKDEMQRIAAEFNLSETVFVQPARDPRNTRHLRIFTPAEELPFAGHPTIGTAHLLAALRAFPLKGDRTNIVLEEEAGPVQVSITQRKGKLPFVELAAPALPTFGPPPPHASELAAVLNLEPGDLLDGTDAPQACSCGVPYLFVPVRDRSVLARVQVDGGAWRAVLAHYWAPAVYVFCRDPELKGSALRARMFGPGLGIVEDPATGSAAAAIAGYLASRDSTREGTLRWRIEQGFEMGRPSLLDVEADIRQGKVKQVRVGGTAVRISDGELRPLPKEKG
jgi:trans-2,3-dihydro-3-hydroxyanthranilate isomerase